jgi:hypothetical protein
MISMTIQYTDTNKQVEYDCCFRHRLASSGVLFTD